MLHGQNGRELAASLWGCTLRGHPAAVAACARTVRTHTAGTCTPLRPRRHRDGVLHVSGGCLMIEYRAAGRVAGAQQEKSERSSPGRRERGGGEPCASRLGHTPSELVHLGREPGDVVAQRPLALDPKVHDGPALPVVLCNRAILRAKRRGAGKERVGAVPAHTRAPTDAASLPSAAAHPPPASWAAHPGWPAPAQSPLQS